MNCQLVRNCLTAFVDGEASFAETQYVRSHLQGCAGCRSELARLVATQSFLQQNLQALANEAGPSPAAWGAIQSQLNRTESNMQTNQYLNIRPRLSTPRKIAWAALLIAFLTVGLVSFVPPLRVQAQRFLQQIILGPFTSVYQTDAQAGLPGGKRPLARDEWVIRTEIGNFGGNIAPGQEAKVLSFTDLEIAQVETGSVIRQPASLPENYHLREVKVARVGNTPWVFQFYAGPGHDIVVAQMAGGPQPSADPTQFSAIKSGVLTDGPVEQVDFDGHPAAWIDGHTLLWAEGDLSWEVGGLDLDLEQTKEIARSLR